MPAPARHCTGAGQSSTELPYGLGAHILFPAHASSWAIMLSFTWGDLSTVTKTLGDPQNPIIVIKCPPQSLRQLGRYGEPEQNEAVNGLAQPNQVRSPGQGLRLARAERETRDWLARSPGHSGALSSWRWWVERRVCPARPLWPARPLIS